MAPSMTKFWAQLLLASLLARAMNYERQIFFGTPTHGCKPNFVQILLDHQFFDKVDAGNKLSKPLVADMRERENR